MEAETNGGCFRRRHLNAYSRIKIYEFILWFQGYLFKKFELTIFQQCGVFHCRVYWEITNDWQWKLTNGGVITNDGYPECIIFVPCTVYHAHGRNNALQTMFSLKKNTFYILRQALTHWGRMTHIGLSKLTIIGLNNGLSAGRRQAIIWTNAGIFFVGPLRIDLNEILIEIYIFSFRKTYSNM